MTTPFSQPPQGPHSEGSGSLPPRPGSGQQGGYDPQPPPGYGQQPPYGGQSGYGGFPPGPRPKNIGLFIGLGGGGLALIVAVVLLIVFLPSGGSSSGGSLGRVASGSGSGSTVTAPTTSSSDDGATGDGTSGQPTAELLFNAINSGNDVEATSYVCSDDQSMVNPDVEQAVQNHQLLSDMHVTTPGDSYATWAVTVSSSDGNSTGEIDVDVANDCVQGIVFPS